MFYAGDPSTAGRRTLVRVDDLSFFSDAEFDIEIELRSMRVDQHTYAAVRLCQGICGIRDARKKAVASLNRYTVVLHKRVYVSVLENTTKHSVKPRKWN